MPAYDDEALTSYCDQLTGRDSGQCLEHPWQKRPEIFHAIPETDDGNHGDTDAFDVLLKLDTRVICDEDVEPRIDRSAQQDTITKARPPLCAHRRSFVVGKLGG